MLMVWKCYDNFVNGFTPSYRAFGQKSRGFKRFRPSMLALMIHVTKPFGVGELSRSNADGSSARPFAWIPRRQRFLL